MKSKFLIISLIIGIIVCLFFALHVWVISNISHKYDDIQNISNNVQIDVIKNQKLNNLKKSLKNAGEAKNALLSLFLKEDDIPNFIQSLETEMKSLKITGMTKSVSERTVPELTSASKDELLITLEAEASYQDLMRFVTILENLPYKSYISSATVSKEDLVQDTKLAKTGLWKLNLTLNIVKLNTVQSSK